MANPEHFKVIFVHVELPIRHLKCVDALLGKIDKNCTLVESIKHKTSQFTFDCNSVKSLIGFYIFCIAVARNERDSMNSFLARV